MNVCGTNIGTALGYVANADTGFFLCLLRSLQRVIGMHIVTGELDKIAWTKINVLATMLSQNVADILA